MIFEAISLARINTEPIALASHWVADFHVVVHECKQA
jgi:hypothetical protein